MNVNGGKSPEHPASFSRKGKTTGLAFVDGVLYATVNLEDGKWPEVDHGLAWSTDRGATWTQAKWHFLKGTGNFQPAKFVSFGRDYNGFCRGRARVCVCLCCPKQANDPRRGGSFSWRARAGQATGAEALNTLRVWKTPSWSRWSDSASEAVPIRRRQWRHPGSDRLRRVPDRYLVTSFHTGPGQLGVFEAPSLWGPWRTVAYEQTWGGMGSEGEGLTCGFPEKWMSSDGLTVCACSVSTAVAPSRALMPTTVLI